jgi:hypothetical protein
MKKLLILTLVVSALNVILPATVSVVAVSYAQEEPPPAPKPEPNPEVR